MSEFLITIAIILLFVGIIWFMMRDSEEDRRTSIVLLQFHFVEVNKIFRYNYKWWKKKDHKTGVALDSNAELTIDWNSAVAVLLDDVPNSYEKFILSYDEVY